MTSEILQTLDSVSDSIVEIFEVVNYGELYYKRILAACYYDQQIIIEKEHLQPINDMVQSITTEQLVYVIDQALYKFLNKNTAYGFADWAKKIGKLRWKIG